MIPNRYAIKSRADCNEFWTPPTTQRSVSETWSWFLRPNIIPKCYYNFEYNHKIEINFFEFTCICWMTARSNIHKPSLEAATPPISMYDAMLSLLTQIDPTHTKRQLHCKNKNSTFLTFVFLMSHIQLILPKDYSSHVTCSSSARFVYNTFSK